MPTDEPTPTRLRRIDERRQLEITWDTGEVTELPYDELRGYCPCAGCQGHMVTELRFQPPRSSPQPLAISPVGNYAVSILWSDGHTTGIYRFDFLAELPERIERRRRRELQDGEDGESSPS